MDWLQEFFQNNLGGLLQAGIAGYGYKDLMGQFKTLQTTIPGRLQGIEDKMTAAGEFKPYGITSGLGSAQYDPLTGQYNYGLSSTQQANMDQQRLGAQGMFNLATQDPAQRETDVYNRIRAMQQPEETRQYESMNANLFGGGRGGMTSGQYGGSPEQFAFGKAQAEARNQASLQAMQQAQQEMQNYANIGQQMYQNQFAPYAQLQSQFGQGLQGQQLASQAGQNMAGLLAQLGIGGLTTDVNLQNVYGGAFGELVKALGAAAGGIKV